MGKPRLDPLELVSFRCDCGAVFQAVPLAVRDVVDRPWHPFEYIGSCQQCGNDDVPQDGRERGWLKANYFATGPTSPEGLAASAANLDGHPTAADVEKTRFNALKHGAYARTANFFPARPGDYPHCDGCQYFGRECIPKSRAPAGHDNPDACLKRAELFVRHAVAFDSGDPKLLTMLRSDTQAAIQALIDDMILSIARDGSTIRTPEWYYDKEGNFHLAQYKSPTGEQVQLTKLEEHPLLKRLIEYIQKNSLTLADLGMTPKVQDEHDLVRGHLAQESDSRESEQAFRERLEQQNQQLLQLINGSHVIAPPTSRTLDGEVLHD